MTTVHVCLLNEGTDVWVPCGAEHVRDDVYKLTNCGSEGVELQFAAGNLVRCEIRNLSEGDCLVAIEKLG